jgi:hypothetical protein
MAAEEAFAKLLGRHPSEKERERLYRVRDALGIQENDAFWYIVMTLEHYEHYDSLYDGYPAKMAQAAEEAIARARGAFEVESVAVRRLLAEEVRRVAAKSGEELSGFVGVVGAVLAAVVVFGAICVSAGSRWEAGAGSRRPAPRAAWGGGLSPPSIQTNWSARARVRSRGPPS